MPGDFKNNPLYTDITKLDHLSPAPVFNYNWNKTSGFWEPASSISIDIDFDETNRLLSGVSGELSSLEVNVDFEEANNLLSAISGELSNLDVNVDFGTTNALLSGVSEKLSRLDVNVDFGGTNALLSGISGELSNLDVNVDFRETNKLLAELSQKLSGLGGVESKNNRGLNQPWKLRTKTVSQKIEEDFILLESIPEDLRYGEKYGETYGVDKSVMNDVYGTYFNNGRTNEASPETGHPDYFLHAEYTPQNRGVDKFESFHSDTLFALRQENVSASLINSYELEDFNSLYKRGLVDSVTIFNNSPYPIQFHTSERRFNKEDPVSPSNKDLIYLNSDMGVSIKNDEAGRIFVKRPHTISGFTLTYSITYKETGVFDIIPSDRFNMWEPASYLGNKIMPVDKPHQGERYEFSPWESEGEFMKPIDGSVLADNKFSLWEVNGTKMTVK